jgi:uncharacterized protein YjbJ (UPF0337 family)
MTNEHTDKIQGRVEQAAGKLTDDEELEAKGERHEAGGKAKGAVNDAKDKLDGAIDSVQEKLDENQK